MTKKRRTLEIRESFVSTFLWDTYESNIEWLFQLVKHSAEQLLERISYSNLTIDDIEYSDKKFTKKLNEIVLSSRIDFSKSEVDGKAYLLEGFIEQVTTLVFSCLPIKIESDIAVGIFSGLILSYIENSVWVPFRAKNIKNLTTTRGYYSKSLQKVRDSIKCKNKERKEKMELKHFWGGLYIYDTIKNLDSNYRNTSKNKTILVFEFLSEKSNQWESFTLEEIAKALKINSPITGLKVSINSYIKKYNTSHNSHFSLRIERSKKQTKWAIIKKMN